MIAGFFLLCAAPVLAQAQEIEITVLRTIGSDLEFGTLIAGAVAPDGRLYLADLSNNLIHRIDPATGEAGRLGSQGRGPGEFSMLYRIAVAGDGSVFAYDLATGDVSTFSPTGQFVRRAPLPLSIRQVGSMVMVDDLLALSGPAFRAGPLSDSAIHLFDRELRHVRSMGAVPRLRDPRKLDVLGAGFVTGLGPGHLLFTHRLGDSLDIYSINGRRTSAIPLARPLVGRLEDAVEITDADGRRTTRTGASTVEHPTPVHQLAPGRFLTGRVLDGQQVFDLFDARGRRIASSLPRTPIGLFGAGPEPRTFWGTTTVDDIPVVQLVRFDVDS